MPVAQVAGVPLGNAGDQVGGAGQRQRGREAADDRDDLALQPERLQRVVDRPLLEPAPRDADVPAGRIARGRDPRPGSSGCPVRTTPTKRSRNSACARSSGPVVFADDAGLQVDGAVAQRRAVLVGLLHEAQPHAGRLRADARDQGRAEVLHEALAGAQRERADELLRGRASRRGAAPPRASCTSWPTRSRSSSARGVGTRPRPARTSSGSPVASRSRASARLIADGLSRSRRAARATLPSASSTSRVTSRLRSGSTWRRPAHARVTWRQTHEYSAN